MKIAITGHRPDKLGGYNNNSIEELVKDHIKDLFYLLKPTFIWSGMALGVDQWAAELAIKLSIPFKAAVPFEGQESRWPLKSQEKYRELLKCSQEIIVVSPGGYAPWKMQKRNEYMVDRADVVVAVWDGSSGGTKNCVEYAVSQDKTIYLIDPRTIK